MSRSVESGSGAEVSRRTVLRSIAAAGAGVALSQLPVASRNPLTTYSPNLNAMLDAASHLPLPISAAHQEAPLRQNQLAVASNKLLRQTGGRATRAFVAVHPAYITTQVGDMQTKYGKYTFPHPKYDGYAREDIDNFTGILRGIEGDYNAYRRNLTGLFNVMRHTSDPVIVYCEERAGNNAHYPDLRVPDNALVMVTEEGNPRTVPMVSYHNGEQVTTELQEPSLVFDWLREKGVSTIHCAGEFGISRGGGIYPACLGGVVETLQAEHFDVHGIKGAVFPTAPLDAYNPRERMSIRPEDLAMVEALYDRTVLLPGY